MTSPHPSDRFRDPQGELPPPWAVFPDYEHGTIGWRMGTGESYLGWWWEFLATQVGPEPAHRLAYLQRHPPAPVTWWKTVQQVWDTTVSTRLDALEDGDTPGDEAKAEAAAAAQRQVLRDAGVIADDVAYRTWLARGAHPPPWHGNETLVHAARYDTRSLWFWSRKLASMRTQDLSFWDAPPPVAWQAWADVAQSQQCPALDAQQGLASLAWMLAADALVGPWSLGLVPADAEGNFDMDMNSAEAFSLLLMCAFDDRTHQAAVMDQLGLPAGPWTDWVEENTFLEG